MGNAYYIKLGRGGAWETDSIQRGILRFGWTGQTLEDINGSAWPTIAAQLFAEKNGTRGAATNDLNRLKDIVLSTPEDLWIMFHQAKLWWTHMLPGPVEADETSKFRRTQPWSDRSVKGRKLFASEIPGVISALQGFRGTACSVGDVQLLVSTIADEPTPLRREMLTAKGAIHAVVANAIKRLHWKDFETLTDLVFRAAGWIRVGILGETVKSLDLELREPITGDRYAVQVKSTAGLRDLENTLSGFDSRDYKRLFFVVHTPAPSLSASQSLPAYVDLVLPPRMSELVVDAGLLKWVEDRVH